MCETESEVKGRAIEYVSRFFGSQEGVGGYSPDKQISYHHGDGVINYPGCKLSISFSPLGRFDGDEDYGLIIKIGGKTYEQLADIEVDQRFDYMQPDYQRRVILVMVDEDENIVKLDSSGEKPIIKELEYWELLSIRRLAQAYRADDFDKILEVNAYTSKSPDSSAPSGGRTFFKGRDRRERYATRLENVYKAMKDGEGLNSYLLRTAEQQSREAEYVSPEHLLELVDKSFMQFPERDIDRSVEDEKVDVIVFLRDGIKDLTFRSELEIQTDLLPTIIPKFTRDN